MKRLWCSALLILLTAGSLRAADGIATVAFVGDVMLAETEGTGQWVANGGDPFAGVRPLLAGADLRVANFESSAGTRGHPDPAKPYSFRTSFPALAEFASLFEAAGLANNHAGDFGREDLAETLDALRRAGTIPFGGGREPVEAHRATLFERNGVRIALLGYLDFFPRWFGVAPGLPGVAWLDEDQAALDIARARAQGADVVVVVPHWGTEHVPKADDRQRRLARALIDAGADAVIGGHPHVVQDEEVHAGKPIIYSLGNFVFDGFEDEDNVTGWAVFADIDKQGITALRTHVVHLDAHGLPTPAPGKAGPCWQRGDTAMTRCAAPRAVNTIPSR